MKLSEIATKIDCRLVADSDPDIVRIAGIDEAGSGDLTFVSNRKYIRSIKTTRASAIILGDDIPAVSIASLRTSNPYLAFARALALFYHSPAPTPGIHPAASVAEDAELGPDVSIGAFAVVGSACSLGAGVVLHSHVVIYPGVTIGEGTVIHAHSIVREHCRLGKRVTLQNGVVIGCDGFGFAPREDGSYFKIAQTGRVIIDDDVEIGANTTVDRAAVGDTFIGRGAKLDNLVQIGHGSHVGENTLLAAQVGLAGSTHLGRSVRVGGQAGFAGHIVVGDHAVLTAQSGTSHDIAAGQVMSGSPAISNSAWRRSVVAYAKLPELLRRLGLLEREIEKLKERWGENNR